MGIKSRTGNNERILNEVQQGLQRIGDGIFSIMQYTGEEFVKNAREALNISGAFPKGDYTDRTANLRSSIGYYIYKNGKLIHHEIEGTSEGETAAKVLIASLDKPSGYVLYGVAGMDYASYVESKGYNVITSQSDVALVDIQLRINKLQGELKKRKK